MAFIKIYEGNTCFKTKKQHLEMLVSKGLRK